MPRTGGVYNPPAGTKGVSNTTIQSVPYNAFVDDLTDDANAARPVTAGGTGATTASGARTNLGVEIGTNVQAYDAGLASIAGLTTGADTMIYTTATDVYATTALTPFARSVLDDANAAAAVNTLGLRTQLSLAFDLYVNTTTGNDANDGLTALTAFKTITQAIKSAYSKYDQRAGGVTINVADGIYFETLFFYGPPVWSSGPTSGLVYPIKIKGNTTTPGNVSISNDASGGPVRLRSGAVVYFEGVRFVSFTSGCTALDVQDAGSHALYTNVQFAQFAGGNHLFANNGGTISVLGNYTISGGAATHFHATEHSLMRVYNSPTITLTGTPAFSNFFAGVSNSTLYARGITFSGSATGQRYYVHKGGLIDTNNAGINYFPGSIAGQAINGGDYDLMQLGRNIVFAQPGYVIHDNGFWEMWGFSTFNAENAVSFPASFPTNCFGVIATPAQAPPSNGAYFIHVSSVTNSGFTASGRQFSGGSVSTAGISGSWRAWGN